MHIAYPREYSDIVVTT